MIRSGQSTNPWVFNARQYTEARLRLFCFPYAGGGASVYAPWVGALAPTIEVYPVQLPGRENRLKEKPYLQFDELIQALVLALSPLFTKPFAFFGHSMGALISFGLTQQLLKQGHPLPEHLFLSAYRAPQIPNDESLRTLSDAALMRKVLGMNGTQPQIFENAEIRQFLLPLMRADFSVCETYVHAASEPLERPITVFGGLQDNRAIKATVEPWSEQTCKAFRICMLPGDHFFWRNAPQPLLQLIKQELQPYLVNTVREKGEQAGV